MENRQTVALLMAHRGCPPDRHAIALAGVARSLDDWTRQVARPGIAIRREAFGTGWAPPLLRDQASADLLAKVRTGDPFPFGAGRWACFPSSDFHETKHAYLWADSTTGWPLWKGESFNQYDPHGKAPRTCAPTSEALKIATGSRPGAGSVLADVYDTAARQEASKDAPYSARVAFSDVTQKDNSRTVVAVLVPPETFLGNTAPYLLFVRGDVSSQATCLAILNSLVFDWQARRFAEVHMNFFILEGLTVPILSDEAFDALAEDAARLSCPDERFADFAKAAGVGVEALDPDERARLRADIDARVAHAWQLTADDLEVVFADFTLDAVTPTYRDAVRARFLELAS